MGVVRAKIQTVEDIYQLVKTAVVGRQPIEAVYDGYHRLLCPHRLGRNKDGEFRVLCYQYGGQSRSGLQPAGSAANWRCIVVEKLGNVKLLTDRWRTAPNHSRPQTCIVEADVDVEDQPGGEPQNGQ
jgi:hypothetical protein